ncbi:hypothetical protein [Streptomyces sp. AK02-01A]|uniref:hypothetical protein n=1 Tax=Streptomyces sp. AK02-01A TaxID=3028648 RepID=UPI0029ABB8F9|nr:hypothetical protein [Streptomyces sp. AK02-01A]MDX3851338.1 hypothetical protein [Streptomyces sp. AK02-01A]
MSEIMGTAVAHEAYAFCCMHCGHGWEQAYDIEHHVDGSGQNFVVYKSDGVRVPSPLSSPSCLNCGGHIVRIMRSGQVSSVRAALMMEQYRPAKGRRAQDTGAGKTEPAEAPARPADGTAAGPGEGISAGASAAGPVHHWHLSDLLHPFHHRK